MHGQRPCSLLVCPCFAEGWGSRCGVNRWGTQTPRAARPLLFSPVRGETQGPGVRPTSGSRFSPSHGAVRPISGTKFSPSQGETERVLLAGGRRSSSGERPRRVLRRNEGVCEGVAARHGSPWVPPQRSGASVRLRPLQHRANRRDLDTDVRRVAQTAAPQTEAQRADRGATIRLRRAA